MTLALSDDAPAALPEQGLTAGQASEILRHDGPNALPQDRQRGPFRIVLDAVREPMLQLLLGAGVLYLIVGDLAEALILLAFAVLNVGLVVVQESRTEHALAALKDLTSPGAFVIRDGLRQRIPGGEVVVGDIVVLVEGDRVPANPCRFAKSSAIARSMTPVPAATTHRLSGRVA